MTVLRPARNFVLIGHPVGHSLSPAIHRAAYRELGLPEHGYLAVDCPDEMAVRREVLRVRRGDLVGANVTVPWKRLALDLADDVDASASRTRAANVLRAVASDGQRSLVAHNTDVPALAEELARGRPGAESAVIIGSGGAALAAVAACGAIGVRQVGVVARKFQGPRAAEWIGAQDFIALGATPLAWPDPRSRDSDFRRRMLAADILVQTTTDGMHGASDGTVVRGLVPWRDLDRETFVYDVIYNPAVTPFAAAAREAGLRAETGLGMLVGQAVLAIELWFGRKPETMPLRAAAERALAEMPGR